MAIRRRHPLRHDSGNCIRPAIAGADERDLRNRFASDRTFSLFASFYSLFPISFSWLVISSLEKLRGRSADRRHCPVTAPRKVRVATHFALRGAGAPYGARSPTGAPPRHLRQRTNATAQLQPALPGTRRHRVLPASGLSIQSSELPRGTGRSAGRAYPPEPPGSGLRTPPAGTALAPFQGSSRETPSHERDNLL